MKHTNRTKYTVTDETIEALRNLREMSKEDIKQEIIKAVYAPIEQNANEIEEILISRAQDLSDENLIYEITSGMTKEYKRRVLLEAWEHAKKVSKGE
jgi:hypothetical protein